MKIFLRFLLTLVFILATAGQAAAAADLIAPKPSIVAAVALPDESDYWLAFLQALKDQAPLLDMEIIAASAGGNQAQQNAQIDRFLSSSPQILILVPHDALGAAAAVKKARIARVKTLALDRLTLNADLDFYLAYDHEKAGELQAEYLVSLAPQGRYIILGGPPNDYSYYLSRSGAMKILKPLVAAGRIKADEGQVINGEADLARNLVRLALSRPGGRPAAVLAPDDAAAAGALAALKEAGLAGRTPLAGQNGGPAAIRRIRAGEQAMTVFKDTAFLAAEALAVASKLANGENPDALASGSINNGFKDVPARLLKPMAVDRRNLGAVQSRAGQ